MGINNFFAPVYYAKPKNWGEHFHNFVERQLDLGGERILYFLAPPEIQDPRVPTQQRVVSLSFSETSRKVATWILTAGIWPLLMLVAKLALRIFHTPFLPRDFPGGDAISLSKDRCSFQNYIIGQGSLFQFQHPGLVVYQSQAWLSPGEMLVRGIYGGFVPGDDVRLKILQNAQQWKRALPAHGNYVLNPHQYGFVADESDQGIGCPSMTALYGYNVFTLSSQEVRAIRLSQQIYLSPSLPRACYLALKRLLNAERDENLEEVGKLPLKPDESSYTVREFLEKRGEEVEPIVENFGQYGFATQEEAAGFVELPLEEVASFVVKSETCLLLTDHQGRVLSKPMGSSRSPFRLISASGIRGLQDRPIEEAISSLKNLFTTIFGAVGEAVRPHFLDHDQDPSKFLLFPALGIDRFGGDRRLYWNAFFDAVAASPIYFEKIFVSSGADPLTFQEVLEERLRAAPDDATTEKLFRIHDLAPHNTDLLRLADALAESYMGSKVVLVNDSDPNATLGSAVGNHFNDSLARGPDENLAAATTTLLCHEELTGVLEEQGRQRIFHIDPHGHPELLEDV